MKENPLWKLERLGQSIWLDYIRRDLITSGHLHRLIEEDGLRGMTSNPSIFEKAIVDTDDYRADIEVMTHQGKDARAIYDALSIKDVQGAADEFRPVYDATDGRDGFVSLEVNPHLAHDTEGSVAEARRLWTALDRPNVFIKIPATAEGIEAIRQLLSEGINVNITLLFGLPRYRQVAEAYLSAMETRLAQGQSVTHVASVASFFVSRMDALVDPLLEGIIGEGVAEAETARLLHGETAIANAKAAYQIYKGLFGGERFQKLASKGARVQRLLWASTSTKNPDYSDVKYVEALIGPETVNTVPMETLDAYRDHGSPEPRLEEDVEKAYWVLEQLPGIGINIDDVTQQLEEQAEEKFNEPFDKMLETLEKELAKR